MNELPTEEERRRAISWALALTANTPLTPQHYEQELLEQYAQGTMTLQQVLAQLDGRMHHILYRSQATRLMRDDDLTALVEQSRAWNEAHHVTGLLCYSWSGHFVQVLEGAAEDVHRLYARIRQDPRHHHVQTFSDRATDRRWFADWQMALVSADPYEFHWLLGFLEAKAHQLVQPQFPITSPHLLTLLKAFSQL